MQIFVIKLRIFLTRSQINSSLFDHVRVMKILSMLQKYKQTHQRNNEIVCHCAEDLLMLSHIDNSIFDSIVEILCMLPKIYNHKPPLVDLTPKKRSLWARSCWPADGNMSVDRPAGSNSKAPLQIIFVIMVFFKLFICLMLLLFMLCTFVSIFFKTFTTKTIQIKGLMQFGLYNPEGIHAFQIMKYGNPQ